MIIHNDRIETVDKRLITNSYDLKFLQCLREEIKSCKGFKFVIAFIKFSGLQLIVDTLNECKNR